MSKSLVEILNEWLAFRVETVRLRLSHRLEEVLARLHVLEGLLIAYLNLDRVIAIIRHNDAPKPLLMDEFHLTDIQAEAILQLRLRHLARLEEAKIQAEHATLEKERLRLEKILGSENRLKALVKKELVSDAEIFGNPRRTKIVERDEARVITEIDSGPVEPVTVILSREGWVRMAKGYDVIPEELAYKSGDDFLASARGRSNQAALFLDSTGRAYAAPVSGMPSARSHGTPLTGYFGPPRSRFISVVMEPLLRNCCLPALQDTDLSRPWRILIPGIRKPKLIGLPVAPSPGAGPYYRQAQQPLCGFHHQ
ncbi:MAG: DNA gyrase subunit A [Desulfobacterales bacterium]